jgi:hypothetical protein
MIFIENVQKKPERSRRFHPSRFDSQNAIFHEQVILRHRSKRTALGTSTVPSSILPLLYISSPEKGILLCQIFPVFLMDNFFNKI